MDIYSLLEENHIILGEDKIKKNIVRTKESIINQIDLIITVENALMGHKNIIIPTINSTIGKDLEGYKVAIKKNLKTIKGLIDSPTKSDLDLIIIEEGTKILNRAQRAIDRIDYDSYLSLIKRSMRRYEVSIGRGDEGNINVDEEGFINVKSIKYISYNLIEHDLLNYLRKIKRRAYDGQIETIINHFIINGNLDSKSKDYIISLNNYPYDSMRVLSKYKIGVQDKDTNEWISDINVAKQNDGKELI